jgi:PKHD-type hydroxylase
MKSQPFDPAIVFDISPRIMPGFLTVLECEQLVAFFHKGQKETGKLRPAIRTSNAAEVPAMKSIRNNTVCWLEDSESTYWIYKKVNNLMVDVNAAAYGFRLDQLQPIQLAEYKFTDDHHLEFYKSHLDICTRGWAAQRKLSLSVQLSSPESYEGGDLLIFGDKNDLVMDPANLEQNLLQRRQQGTAVLFPSFFEHEVTPLRKGTRYSLVAWMEGPNWQ